MELHLPLVVATPTLLCLLAALAALLWPRRSVLWPFLLPAWGLDLYFLGLLQSRAELAGPVLVWFRIDLPGLVWTALAGPIAAVLSWRLRATPAFATLRQHPVRLALFHALVVAFGLVPVPLLLLAVPLLGIGSFRWRAAPAVLAAALLGAALAWPFAVMADLAGAAGAIVLAVAWAPRTPCRAPVTMLALAWAVLGVWRALSNA